MLPDYDMHFPTVGKTRLKILVQILMTMVAQTQAAKLVISLTDSGYIYSTKSIKLSGLEKTLESDFEREAPPDRQYEMK